MLKELMSKPFYKEISEAKHTAVLTKWEYKPHASNPENDYICMSFTVDNEIPYKRNMFDRDVSIMFSHVRRQLGKQDETITDPAKFLDELVKDKTELDIWVKYPIVATKNGLQRRQNLYFVEPTAETTATGDTAESAGEEVPPTMAS